MEFTEQQPNPTPDPDEVETPDEQELAEYLAQVAATEGIGFDDDEEGEAG